MPCVQSDRVIHLPTRYQLERLGGCWAEFCALGAAVDPTYDLHAPSFEALDASGCLRLWTARRQHLVGVSLWCVHPDPFHQTILQAQQIAIAVAPEARMSAVALCLVRMATRALEAEGVMHLVAHNPAGGRIGSTLSRFGFHACQTTYAKDGP